MYDPLRNVSPSFDARKALCAGFCPLVSTSPSTKASPLTKIPRGCGVLPRSLPVRKSSSMPMSSWETFWYGPMMPTPSHPVTIAVSR